MTETVLNLYEAKTSLSELVDRAAAGEEIVIVKAGRPLAKLVPLRGPGHRRSPGGWQGKVRISEDFDAPLPQDLLDAFEHLPIDLQHAAEPRNLPVHHRDPFDPMLDGPGERRAPGRGRS